jgi:SAM-dependent methyltransferase
MPTDSAGRHFPARPCPVCGCTRSTLLFQQDFEQLSGVRLLDGYRVVICEDCGAGFADDIPPQPVFDRYYRDFSKYDNASGRGDEAPQDAFRFLEIAATIIPFIPASGARILEIGCGSGELLRTLRDRGYGNVLGVDPSPACVQTTQNHGVPAIVASIATVPPPEHRYGFLILIGVLEHIRDLDCAVEQLSLLLDPNGRIYLEVPDASRYLPGIDAPFQEFSVEHINFFSRCSLTNLMQWRGFRAIAGGHSVRAQNEVTCPTAFAVFEKSSHPLPIEPDTETATGLRNYIHAGQAEDRRIRDLIRQAVPNDGQMIVWGVGTHTLRLLASGGLDPARISLFVDSSPNYQGQELRGVRVVPPEALRHRPEPILISSRGFQRAIYNQIRNTLQLANPVIRLYDEATEGRP